MGIVTSASKTSGLLVLKALTFSDTLKAVAYASWNDKMYLYKKNWKPCSSNFKHLQETLASIEQSTRLKPLIFTSVYEMLDHHATVTVEIECKKLNFLGSSVK